ncbi:MAG: dihydrodipicolinate reductase [Candidatus Aminicenantes bacterium]|nr:dihydrodipicolinate reductase [Candidatus Aminicenantes bacterium]
MQKLNVIIYGCGVMGRKATEALLNKESFSIVGAIDIDPALVGKDLGEILDNPTQIGVIIDKDADALFSRVKADAVVLTTTSHFKSVQPQITQCINAGLNVVSTCEELSYPWKRIPELAEEIDKMAKEAGVTIVGTGINPGYLMDSFPLVLTAPCLRVDSVKVTRMMNSAKRRIPFQKKVGTSMTPDEFRQKIEDKVITGHVGLLESINMIADGLGWKLDKAVELPPEAVIAKDPIETGMGRVEPGNVIGLKSIAYAERAGKKIINLEFFAYAGVVEEYDEVIVEGVPRIHERIIGGVHGDIGTVAVTINTIPNAVSASPGVKTMKDLPAASCTP